MAQENSLGVGPYPRPPKQRFSEAKRSSSAEDSRRQALKPAPAPILILGGQHGSAVHNRRDNSCGLSTATTAEGATHMAPKIPAVDNPN